MTPPTLDLDKVTLKRGAHSSPDDGMCAMEAVSILAGEDFGDSPSCTSPVIAAFLRSWNDTLPDDQRQQLKQHVMSVIGTNRGPGIDIELAWMCTDWMVRIHTPAWLRLAGLTAQADLLSGLVPLTADTTPSILPTLKSVRSDAADAAAAAWAAAQADARDADRTAAQDAAGAAAQDAARDAAWAADRDAAVAAAGDAARDAARYAAWAAARAAAGADDRADAWDAAWAAARAAARYAAWSAAAAQADARDALAPTVAELQASAHDLIVRMCEHARNAAHPSQHQENPQ